RSNFPVKPLFLKTLKTKNSNQKHLRNPKAPSAGAALLREPPHPVNRDYLFSNSTVSSLSEAEKTHPQWAIPKNNPRQICETQKKRCSNSISNRHQALIEFLQTQNESTKPANSAFVATRKGL
ncbi:hypothetical protein, partial [Asticcacaulis taihuensis]|uniref:hypothetical protein n=1 Tax=Asticcacaulis taihuensis TaxID=260084 RepID=UPI003F7C2D3F